MRFESIVFPVAIVFLASSGCSKPKPTFERIHVGMNEDEVTRILGKPSTSANQGTTKYFEYESYDRDIWLGSGRKENIQIFFVRFVDGKAESYGRKGDFDSTKNPTREIKIDQKIETNGRIASSNNSSTPAFDLKAELQKLEQMKKEGLLTEQEFKELRQRAIDKAKAQ